MVDPFDFYAAPGPLTAAGRHRMQLSQLPAGLGDLAEVVSGLGIYDVVARDFYGVDVPEARKREIHMRAFDDMLADLFQRRHRADGSVPGRRPGAAERPHAALEVLLGIAKTGSLSAAGRELGLTRRPRCRYPSPRRTGSA